MLFLDDLEIFDIYFFVFDDVVVYDYEEEVLWFIIYIELEEVEFVEEKLFGLEDMWCFF